MRNIISLITLGLALVCLVQKGMGQEFASAKSGDFGQRLAPVPTQSEIADSTEPRLNANWRSMIQGNKASRSEPTADDSEVTSRIESASFFKSPRRDSKHPSRFEQFHRNTRELIQSSRDTITNWGTRSGAAFRSASEEFRQNSSRTWESILGSLRRSPPGKIEAKPKPLQRGPVNWHARDSRR